MRLRLLGHAAFYLESSKGTRIITDPYQSGFKGMIHFGPILLESDLVTVSHEHGDHCSVENLPGKPLVLRGNGSWNFGDVEVKGFPSYHDAVGGTTRGTNTIFVITVDGFQLCHLGDLGHLLDDGDIKRIGSVDILLLPVGGNFTIGPKEALEIATGIGAHIWIPMHYKTQKVDFDLAFLEEFLALVEDRSVKSGREISLKMGTKLTEEGKIVILEPIL